MIIGRIVMIINKNCEVSMYLITISDNTKIKNKYKKTFTILKLKLFSIFEKVNKKQHTNVKSGK